MLRHILKPVRNIRNGARSYTVPADYKFPHMDDLPVPSGSWQQHYDKKQKLYNMQLGASIGLLLASVGLAKAAGLLYVNYTPPTLKE